MLGMSGEDQSAIAPGLRGVCGPCDPCTRDLYSGWRGRTSASAQVSPPCVPARLWLGDPAVNNRFIQPALEYHMGMIGRQVQHDRIPGGHASAIHLTKRDGTSNGH